MFSMRTVAFSVVHYVELAAIQARTVLNAVSKGKQTSATQLLDVGVRAGCQPISEVRLSVCQSMFDAAVCCCLVIVWE